MLIIMARWTFDWSENIHCTDLEEVGNNLKTSRKMPMKHKTSLSLVFVSRIVIALAILFVAQPVVGAQSSETASVVEANQDGFSAAASVPGVRFVHIARAANTIGNRTYIDHPLTNDNPNAIVFVTQNYNPGGVGDQYNDQPIGVLYSSAAQKWAVFNQDTTADMPVDAAFNVIVFVKIYLPIILR
jgi:hypothetical protein